MSSTMEPAAAGSFGEPPRGFRLPEATRLGPVKLQVADLEQSIEWYHRVLGFHASSLSSGGAWLTPDGTDHVLVELVERPGAKKRGLDRQLGLFHFAILLPDRASLASFAEHVAHTSEQVEASDHLVSEALYLHDPDALGIEVYADRPREIWNRIDRELVMGTEPLDFRALLATPHAAWSGMPAGTTMGHMHLHVGDLNQAADFFSETIGFDRIVLRYPGALFMSAGGYHHHLGTNTWAGPTAREPREDDARLLEWTMVLPTRADIAAVQESLVTKGAPVSVDAGAIVTRDPWGTAIRIQPAA
jgi:catechol 2,3-dioxygenase